MVDLNAFFIDGRHGTASYGYNLWPAEECPLNVDHLEALQEVCHSAAARKDDVVKILYPLDRSIHEAIVCGWGSLQSWKLQSLCSTPFKTAEKRISFRSGRWNHDASSSKGFSLGSGRRVSVVFGYPSSHPRHKGRATPSPVVGLMLFIFTKTQQPRLYKSSQPTTKDCVSNRPKDQNRKACLIWHPFYVCP